MTTTWQCAARAKVNLCLFVGPVRPDGRHELVTVMESTELHDLLTLAPAGAGAVDDDVLCPGVEGPNLASAALAAFRAETGWDAPPVRVTIRKHIPVAGGMAGGSADAAATLRLAAAAAGVDDAALLERIAVPLGADVPSQVRGGRLLAEGAGERLTRLPAIEAHEVAVVRVDGRLSAGAVYAELDRRGGGRGAAELAELREQVLAAEAADGVVAAGLAHNDLQDAAIALCPPIAEALGRLRFAGADHALVSGSGPTVFGLRRGPFDGRVLGEAFAGWPGEVTTGPFAAPDPVWHWPVPAAAP